MARTEAELEALIENATGNVTAQGGKIRELKDQVKAKKKAKEDTAELDAQIATEVEALQSLKAAVLELEKELEAVTGIPRNAEAFREAVTRVLESRLFYKQSFHIYGGVAGLYDYGPPGTAVKANLTQFWRQHFVVAESMLEVECPAVTPAPVLKASGHVDRFTDFMVLDAAGNALRADHLLEDKLEEIISDAKTSAEAKEDAKHDLALVGEMDAGTLGAKLKQFSCASPYPDGGALSDPFPFNLMFKTSIGPKGDTVGYLRPETAQGIFVNFRDLLYYNGGKLPFAAAQIGQSFRNEIHPVNGLLRVREFTQAEIEHFVHPDKKEHARFHEVADLEPQLYSVALQQGASKRPQTMRLGDAVRDGIIANETLGYFIGRTFLFMLAVGINPRRLMFRQHLPNEMAHYACDCWDAEVHTTHGWIECAGLADRSAYDLKQHTAASKTELVAHEQFDEPVIEEGVEVTPQMKVLGKELKSAGKAVAEHLKALGDEDALKLKEKLETEGSAAVDVGGTSYKLTPETVTVERVTRRVTGRNFTPSVIEPSFGIGRILYCIFEHTFYTRKEDQQKTVFGFSPVVAPIKVTVFPLLQRTELNDVANKVASSMRAVGLTCVVDTTGVTIGKRYARTDELGVPFAVTVDYDTVREGANSNTVTLRERDSTQQIRVPVPEVAACVKQMCDPIVGAKWEDMLSKYPRQADLAEE